MAADYVGWVFGAAGLVLAGYQTRQARRSDARLKRIEAAVVRRAIERPEDARRKTDVFSEPHTFEARQALGEAIARLPEREKLVLTLYFYEGLSSEEIAGILGVSPNAVDLIRQRAVTRLRRTLESNEES